ncbi:TetR/AcrR family transcriptional regulator [Marixanthomonas ophiurae]|uniref:TetR/AcrR family transcriptional regulator n=1 Tax=Marixanthomonas ophiurae TaxID=387659 RepID=A0A3E1QAW7_9FLAO|nr:TetR/AcrR family transcriptional regulator [Marixanthomonas ophiurae]RFN59268.1 TetR/AcrR family transcriptional regulator [Marixanthomonas ophiurae]
MQDDNKKIIIKTLELFKKYGVKSVSMDDIAKALAVSKKTLYTYFDSKDLLIKDTICYVFTEHFSKIDRILEKDLSPLQKIILIYRYGINQMVSYDPAFYFELKKYHISAHKHYEKYKNEIIFETILGLLKEAQEVNEIRQDLNLNLFCEIHLFKIDEILADPEFNTQYSTQQMLNHLVVYNLRGIVIDASLID